MHPVLRSAIATANDIAYEYGVRFESETSGENSVHSLLMTRSGIMKADVIIEYVGKFMDRPMIEISTSNSRTIVQASGYNLFFIIYSSI